MKTFQNKTITKEHLLEENITWIEDEYPEKTDSDKRKEVKKMMEDTFPLIFESEKEEEEYHEFVNNIEV